MFAVVNHLHFNKPVSEFAGPIETSGVPLLKEMPGFRGLYFVKEAEDRGIVIILWESGEDAKNGAEKFGPTWFAEHIAPFLASEQVRTVGPVLAHS